MSIAAMSTSFWGATIWQSPTTRRPSLFQDSAPPTLPRPIPGAAVPTTGRANTTWRSLITTRPSVSRRTLLRPMPAAAMSITRRANTSWPAGITGRRALDGHLGGTRLAAGPSCMGPLGAGPCAAVAEYLAQLLGQTKPPTFDPQRIQIVGNDASVGPICNGPLGNAPCALVQQYILDHVGSSSPQLPPLPGLGSLNAQQVAIACAGRAGFDVPEFASCAGQQAILSPRQQAIVDCAIFSTSSAQAFAECAAPQLGVTLSDDQRLVAGCAMKSKGHTDDFLVCAGSAVIDRNLTADEKDVLSCAEDAGDDGKKFASCSASHLLGRHASKEQQIAIQCAAQSEGDYAQMGTCVGANLFNLNLNPEQQIAVQCVVSTGGQPYAAAACMATRLTARELTKCFTDCIDNSTGCFGDNNDLFGKNGWTARTLGQIPGQIWGGDNSFIRNPGQIWGGSNSFARNPSQFWAEIIRSSTIPHSSLRIL
jgi:hypothetical protein